MSDCIAWGGHHRESDGRPVTSGTSPKYVYRIRYEEMYGELSPEIVLHHTCWNAWCINVSHLVPMTRAKHLAEHERGGDWGQADKTHCPSGHPYDEVNTYTYTRKDGRVERHCKPCRVETKRRYRARQKEKS